MVRIDADAPTIAVAVAVAAMTIMNRSTPVDPLLRGQMQMAQITILCHIHVMSVAQWLRNPPSTPASTPV